MAKIADAVAAMNAQPDISGDDSSRLQGFCRMTATDIKAVGGVSAATSLEMIGYMRELETQSRGRCERCDLPSPLLVICGWCFRCIEKHVAEVNQWPMTTCGKCGHGYHDESGCDPCPKCGAGYSTQIFAEDGASTS